MIFATGGLALELFQRDQDSIPVLYLALSAAKEFLIAYRLIPKHATCLKKFARLFYKIFYYPVFF